MRRRDGCNGKKRHKALLSAQVALKKAKNAQMHIYKCPGCGHYHIGRSRDPWLKEKRLDQIFRQIHKADENRKANQINSH